MKPSIIPGPQICMQRDFAAVEFVQKNITSGEFSSIICMGGSGKDIVFNALCKKTFTLPHTVKILNATTIPELKDFIAHIENDENPLICLINLRIGEDVSWFVERLQILRQQRSTQFIPVIVSYIGDVYTALSKMNKLLTLSSLPLLPIDKTDADILLSDFEKRYTCSLSTEKKETLFKISGGLVGLLKTLFLIQKDDPAQTFFAKALLQKPSIQFRLQQVITGIPEDMLKGLVENTLSKNNQLFFERFGIIHNGQIVNKLLELFLKQKSTSTKLNVTKLLTPQELSAFNHLQARVEDLVSRSELAETLWSKNAEEKYSDWAIDQLIHKLREKIKQANLPYEIITKKGEGFILTPQATN